MDKPQVSFQHWSKKDIKYYFKCLFLDWGMTCDLGAIMMT